MSAPLRPLGALDLELAAGIHARCFEPMGERGWTRQDFAELLAAPGVAGWLAGDFGVALGRTAADEAELLTIAVLDGHRRLGAGARLLAAVMDWAKERGAARLYLEVGADNSAARALYGRAGFTEAGRRRAYYRRGKAALADAVIMQVVFSPA